MARSKVESAKPVVPRRRRHSAGSYGRGVPFVSKRLRPTEGTVASVFRGAYSLFYGYFAHPGEEGSQSSRPEFSLSSRAVAQRFLCERPRTELSLPCKIRCFCDGWS